MFWEDFKTYTKEHKKEVILIGLGVICLGTCIALGDSYRKNQVVDSQLLRQVAKNIKDTPYNVVRESEFCEILPKMRVGYDHPFDVRSHVRTLPNGWYASPEMQAAAEAMGIKLESGQTIVRGYVKGDLAA